MKKLLMALAVCALTGAVQAAGTLTVNFGTDYSGYTVWAVNFWNNFRAKSESMGNQAAPTVGYGTSSNDGPDYAALLDANTSNPDVQIALLNNNAYGSDYALFKNVFKQSFTAVDAEGYSTQAACGQNMYSWLFVLVDDLDASGKATYGTKYAVIQGPEQVPQVDNPGTPTATYNDISQGYTITPTAANVLTTGIVAIPEPTSGLLLLLGVAGLALKRKRA